MRQAPVLLGFALSLLGACRATRPPERAASEPAASKLPPTTASAPAPAPSAATSLGTCRADPGTVYGSEAVTFVVDGPAIQQPVVAELLDERRTLMRRVTLSVPGAFHPEGLGSGDFELRLGGASCVVTINRELSRGSAGQTR
jgi:hypothetical protein